MRRALRCRWKSRRRRSRCQATATFAVLSLRPGGVLIPCRPNLPVTFPMHHPWRQQRYNVPGRRRATRNFARRPRRKGSWPRRPPAARPHCGSLKSETRGSGRSRRSWRSSALISCPVAMTIVRARTRFINSRTLPAPVIGLHRRSGLAAESPQVPVVLAAEPLEECVSELWDVLAAIAQWRDLQTQTFSR